ncbi:MAG: hypothetical protein WC821_04150 [archaeon]|jgi:hypothetical protein
MYFPKQVVYSFFVVLFSLVFFGMLFLVFFSQALDVVDPSVSIIGSDIVLKMTIKNISTHAVDGVKVEVINGEEAKSFYLKGVNDGEFSSLAPGEKYDFVAAIPISESLAYSVSISAPFNRAIPLNFTLEQTTIDPVKAEVSLPSKLYLNEAYTYSVKLCNVSGSDLSEVIWLENAPAGLFKENFFERSISLKAAQCTTIFSTLTPIKLNDSSIGFILKIGTIEKKSSKALQIVERSA